MMLLRHGSVLWENVEGVALSGLRKDNFAGCILFGRREVGNYYSCCSVYVGFQGYRFQPCSVLNRGELFRLIKPYTCIQQPFQTPARSCLVLDFIS